MRRLLLLFLVASLIACSSDGGGRESSGLEGPDTEGDPVPEATFTRFDGDEGSLADYDGRPLVINWFASWCVPCVTEMPAFEEVHQRLGDEVAFLGLNNQDTLEEGQALADETGVTYDLGRDPRGEILALFGGIGMPTTVLISADGRIVETKTGELSAGELETLIQEKLLP